MNWDERIAKLQEAWLLEKQEEQRRFAEAMQAQSMKERRENGITLYPMHCYNTGFGAGNIPYVTLQTPESVFGSKFSGGAAVQLSNGEEATTGVINQLDRDQVRVYLNEKDIPDWVFEDRLEMNLVPDFRTYELGEITLNATLSSKTSLVKYLQNQLLGKGVPNPTNAAKYNNEMLNDSQCEAVGQITSDSPVTIVHGPPGTGKTSTLLAAIQAILKDQPHKRPILACTSSNAAIDHLCAGLIALNIKVVRIGHPGRVDSKSASCSIDAKIQGHKDFELIHKWRKMGDELRETARKYKRSFGPDERMQRKLLMEESRKLRRDSVELEERLKQAEIDGAQVIACTLTGSAHPLIADLEFNFCFIDEASQALEPLTWIPILKSKQLILAGDHHQLPPTVLSHKASDLGLNATLFDQLIDARHPAQLLNVQYRMQPNIAQFSNDWFYEGKLQNHPTPADFDDHANIEFIDTAGCDFQETFVEETKSRYNDGEWNILQKRLADVIAHHPQDIAFISPYRGQVQWMSNDLPNLQSNAYPISINSIDAYQGQEADVVLISLVRSNDKAEIGFLKDYRRMNVALTRARKKLIIIGDSATLGGDPFFGKLLEFVEANGAYRSAWEWMYD